MNKYKEEADDLFSSLLNDIQPELPPRDILVNITNPIIKSLKDCNNEALEPVLKLLYVQALLLGRHPLGVKELDILNNNLSLLIEYSLLK